MKTIFTLITMVGFALSSFAQSKSNLVVFSAQGEQFYVVLNGIRQNIKPETNVKISDINEGIYYIKVVFANGQPDLDKKNVMVEPGQEYTMMVEKDKKGKYKLKYRGVIPYGEMNPVGGSAETVYHATEISTNNNVNTNNTSTNTNVNGSSMNTNMNVNQNTNTTTTTTTTETTTVNSGVNGVNTNVNVNDESNGNSENVNVNMNVGGFGMNVNVNVNDDMTNENVEYSSTTTTTTTSTTTNSTSGDVSLYEEGSTEEVAHTSSSGCYYPMSDTDFKGELEAVKDESFEDDQLAYAKRVAKNNCLTTEMVGQVMDAFSFSDGKLDFAKYAYDYVYDKKNYYKLSKNFTFSSDKEDFEEFLETKE